MSETRDYGLGSDQRPQCHHLERKIQAGCLVCGSYESLAGSEDPIPDHLENPKTGRNQPALEGTMEEFMGCTSEGDRFE